MKVIVIGAGVSGLTSVKSCLEAGFQVTCYELTDCIGGLWKYRDGNPEHVSLIQKSTIINSSKEMSAFSDFPPPAEFSNFMHNRVMWSYLDIYATEFKMLPHVRFNHQVLSCTKSGDHDVTGNWVVKGQNTITGEAWEDVANAVMVCNGHLAKPNLPKFPGMDKFKGQVIHTREYKCTIGYEDKNIVVVGIGSSAGDAAAELSTVTNQLYLSTRSGSWILKRTGERGIPGDFLLSRFLGCILSISFTAIANFIESNANKAFDHELYGLKPKHRVLEQHPVVNDELPNRISSGRITIKGDIDHFTEDGVYFVNEETEYKVDVVVMATGYLIEFPFLEHEIVNFNPSMNKVQLYKYILPPQMKHATLAIIGLIQPYGSLLPLAEAQARWFIQVLLGNVKLPTYEEMMADINSRMQRMDQRFKVSSRYTIEVDWQDYLDDVNGDFGARPSLPRLLFTDPKLFWRCLFGPLLPYQYRLRGPNAWAGARDAIMTAEDRVKAPLLRQQYKIQQRSYYRHLFYGFLLAGLGFILFKHQTKIHDYFAHSSYHFSGIKPCFI